MAMEQATGFESTLVYQRRAPSTTLTPTAEDFDTVSHLNRGIEQGFEKLAAHLGESTLFAGAPDAQLGPDVLELDGLFPVTDLASALKAVQVIIEQGEGGREQADLPASEQSHYARFKAMGDEYDAFLAADPGFTPYRPVATDPVMLAPIDENGHMHVAAADAARVLDAANAAYGLMLRLLASGTGVSRGAEALRKIEIDGAVSLMHVVGSLALALTTLPVNQEGALCAGMNFHLPRSALALPQRHAGAVLMAERAREIGLALGELAATIAQVKPELATRMADLATSLSAQA